MTGELRLCMQIIVTAGKEQATYGRSVLDRENDFRRLIALFTELNNVIYRKHHGGMTLADEVFLKENTISELALEVAEAVYASIARARETSPEFWERRK